MLSALFDDVLKKGNETVQTGQLKALAWCMYSTEGWAERNHVQIRIFVQEQSAFQTGMYCTHYGLFTEESDIGFFTYFQDV